MTRDNVNITDSNGLFHLSVKVFTDNNVMAVSLLPDAVLHTPYQQTTTAHSAKVKAQTLGKKVSQVALTEIHINHSATDYSGFLMADDMIGHLSRLFRM